MKMMYPKILIRMPSWLGDAVMAMPALSQLRRAFPDSKIFALAPPAVIELISNHPDLDQLLTDDAKGLHAGLRGRLRLIRSLRSERFDLGVLFSNSFRSALLFFLAGVSHRLGYRRDGRGLLLNQAVSPSREKMHQRDYYLKLLQGLPEGQPPRPSPASPAPTLWLLPEERTAIQKAGSLPEKGGGDWIGINPGAAYGPSKRWEPSRFAEVADRLVAAFGARILIFGGPEDRLIAEEIARAMKFPAIPLAGRSSLRESMALLSRCRLLLTNDSGPMHVAAALGVPVVALFGPTDPEVTSPFGVHGILRVGVECSPCRHRICPIDHRCMVRLTPESVFEEAAFRLGQTAERGRPVVFLDRDGTINSDEGYVNRPELLSLIPGAAEAIRGLNTAGFPVFVVTNQSGIGRGYTTREGLEAVHQKLKALLKAQGAHLEGIYSCPHAPDRACRCRKPAPGMIVRAIQDFSKGRIDLSQSYIVGDKDLDLLLAKAVGSRPILVRTGYGRETERKLPSLGLEQVPVVEDLAEAAARILNESNGETR